MSYDDSMEDELDRLSEAVAALRKENAKLQADLDAALECAECWAADCVPDDEPAARVNALLEKRRERG